MLCKIGLFYGFGKFESNGLFEVIFLYFWCFVILLDFRFFKILIREEKKVIEFVL